MRSRVTDAALNKNLIDRIAKLQRLYKAALHPDNVALIRGDLVKKAGSILTSIKPGSNSGVNGVEFDEVTSYTNYLGSSNVEHKVIVVNELVMDATYTAAATAKRDKKETDIEVPDGFDGRNGFVFLKLFGLMANGVDVEGQFTGQVVESTQIPFSMKYDQWMLISQTKTKVSVNTFLLRDFLHMGETFDRLYLRGYVVLWRNK